VLAPATLQNEEHGKSGKQRIHARRILVQFVTESRTELVRQRFRDLKLGPRRVPVASPEGQLQKTIM
jgi:hypothetical protein